MGCQAKKKNKIGPIFSFRSLCFLLLFFNGMRPYVDASTALI